MAKQPNGGKSNELAVQKQVQKGDMVVARNKVPQFTTVDYALMSMYDGNNGNGNDVGLALQENLGGGAISPFDFQRIRVPAGGGLAWNIVTPDGKDDVAKEIIGIIAFWCDQKSFWKKNLDDKDARRSPPDCFSPDTKQGIGDPGIVCARCPHNVFGSGKNGRGKACKDVRMLFVVRQNDVLPTLIPAPPTSLKLVRQYFIDLSSVGVPFYRAITALTLKKENNGSNDYSTIIPRCVGVLEPEGQAAAMMKSYSKTIRQMLGKESLVTVEDVTGAGEFVGTATSAGGPGASPEHGI